MAIKLDTSILKKRISIIFYIVSALGFASILGIIFTPKPNTTLYVYLHETYNIVLIFSTIGFIGLAYVFLNLVNFFGFDRNKFMGMYLALSIAGWFCFIYQRYDFMLKPLEEFGINMRFQMSAETQKYQQFGDQLAKIPLSSVHPAIQIIGIETETVNAYGGYPFSWKHYADELKSLEGSGANTVMFDVFFMDEFKDYYGLLHTVESLRDSAPRLLAQGQGINISSAEMRARSARWSDQIRKSGNVIVDFGMETSDVEPARLADPKFKERLAELDKYRIPDDNVVKNEYLLSPYLEWVTLPEPPMAAVSRATKGLGAANVKYEASSVNYVMPMVFKWRNRLYPSISLMLACRYFGIDITKDVEVKLGSYVRLKNIPDKKVSFGVIGEERDIMTKPNKDRMVSIPINEQGMMAINFVGGPYTFPSTKMVELAEQVNLKERTLNVEDYKNKILLTAMYYATGVSTTRDIHPSPFSHTTAGIEHHAGALNTILMQNFVTYAPGWMNYLILFAFAAFLGFIIPRLNIGTVLVLVGIISGVFLVEALLVFKFFRYVHFFLVPYVQVVVVLIAVIGYKVLTEEENVKYIRSTFSKFVSKDIVNELLANPESLKLGGEKKELTVFFSDIRGFTTMSESLSPEDLVNLLNEYLSTMTDLVIAYRGTIDKYMGDAIMAFWGAPVPNPDHAYYACLTALVQLEELKKLQDRWAANGVPVIDIGIGLNSGPAVVGNMGSSHRMDYTVMGDTINLGSRLEGTNKQYGTRIIISEYTYAQVKEKVYVRELDDIKVKGKTEPVKIFELIDVVNREDLEKLRLHVGVAA
ncbi:MAG: adenylate/guanylate cyclase domain-containing protein [Spirochaetes bacterium]|nr:adenylate/guanylate cyclase domain-containing protein [Spirochaetota bacterium]